MTNPLLWRNVFLRNDRRLTWNPNILQLVPCWGPAEVLPSKFPGRFDLVSTDGEGNCLIQGATQQFLETIEMVGYLRRNPDVET